MTINSEIQQHIRCDSDLSKHCSYWTGFTSRSFCKGFFVGELWHVTVRDSICGRKVADSSRHPGQSSSPAQPVSTFCQGPSVLGKKRKGARFCAVLRRKRKFLTSRVKPSRCVYQVTLSDIHWKVRLARGTVVGTEGLTYDFHSEKKKKVLIQHKSWMTCTATFFL